MNFKVKGIVISSEERFTFAIIEKPGQGQSTVYVGEEIDGLSIVAIRTDAIVVNVAGEEREVPLDITDAGGAKKSKKAAPDSGQWRRFGNRDRQPGRSGARQKPPKEFRRGTQGVYEPPRNVLKGIPGIKLVEMDRVKEYAWCCGAGGGVSETNSEFARWTASERIAEAEETGAKAIVTACPGCECIFKDTIKGNGSYPKIYDLIELLEKAV